jgi:hypothetical protein
MLFQCLLLFTWTLFCSPLIIYCFFCAFCQAPTTTTRTLNIPPHNDDMCGWWPLIREQQHRDFTNTNSSRNPISQRASADESVSPFFFVCQRKNATFLLCVLLILKTVFFSHKNVTCYFGKICSRLFKQTKKQTNNVTNELNPLQICSLGFHCCLF